MRWCRIRYTLYSPLTSYQMSALNAIPGVSVDSDGMRVVCTGDIAGIVAETLQAYGCSGSRDLIRLGVPPNPPPLEAVPWLRPEAVAGFFPYQRNGYDFVSRLGGGYVDWPCGSGKTRVGIAFALAEGQRCVIVTKSAATWQWGDWVQQLTTLPPEHVRILTGTTGYKAEQSPPRGATTMCWRTCPDIDLAEVHGMALRGPTLQAACDVLAALPADKSPVPLSNVPKRSTTAFQRLLDVGLVQTFEESEEGWKPWRVVTTEKPRRVVSWWDGSEPLECTDTERVNTWVESSRSPDVPWEMRARYQILYARYQGTPVEVLEQQAAQLLPDRPPTYVREVIVRELLDLEVERRSTDIGVTDATRLVLVGWPILADRVAGLAKWGPDTVVFDESQFAKSSTIWDRTVSASGKPVYTMKANMAGAAAKLAEGRHVRRVLNMSATSLIDRPRDLWNQTGLLDRMMVDSRYRVFATRYCGGHQPADKTWFDDRGSSNLDELHRRMATIRHHVTPDEAFQHLPPLVLDIQRIPRRMLATPPPPSRAEMAAIKAGGALALLHHQLMEAAIAKSPVIVESVLSWLEDGDEVAVFTNRVDHANLLGEVLQARAGVRWPVYVATGGDGHVEDRRALVKTFRGKPGVLIGTTAAWAEAIDGLQGTPHAVIAALTWNVSIVQLLGRFRRHGGGARPTNVHIMIGQGTADERVVDIILPKLHAAGAVLGTEDAVSLAASLTTDQAAEDADLLAQLLAIVGDRDAAEAVWEDAHVAE